MFARRVVARSVITVTKRHAGGWLKKHFPVEEQSGIREVGYTTWKYGFREFWELSKFFFIPSAILYVLLIRGWEDRNVAVGEHQKYGILPPYETWGHEGFYSKTGWAYKHDIRKP